MILRTYRNMKRKTRWLARLVGIFCAFFAYEYLTANPHPQVLGAADPYAGAIVGYLMGNLLVIGGAIWLLGLMRELVSRLFGRR